MTTEVGRLQINAIWNSAQWQKGMKTAMTQAQAFKSSLVGISKSWIKAGATMEKTGRTMTRNITAPLALIGVASVKAALDYDESMTKIIALTNASREEVEGMSDEVLNLAGATGRAPVELSNALFTIVSAGQSASEAMETLRFAALASANGLGDTQKIAQALTGIMASYADSGMTAARATDLLSAIVKEGNLNAEDLAPTLGRITGIASSMGVSFEEVGASIATFTRLGVDSAEAVTGLRGLLSAIQKPTEGAAKIFDQLAKQGFNVRESLNEKGLAGTLAELLKAFEGNEDAITEIIPNVRALSTVLGTAGVQGDDYAEVLNNIANNSEGLTETAFGETQQSEAFQFSQALASMKVAAIELGNELMPTFKAIIETIKDWVSQFRALDDSTKANIVQWGLYAAAAGPVLLITGKLIKSIGLLVKGLANLPGTIKKVVGALKKVAKFAAANPWLIMATAIIALAAIAIPKLVAAFDKHIDKQEVINNLTKTAKGLVAEEASEIGRLMNSINNENTSNELRISQIEKLKGLVPGLTDVIDDQGKITDSATAAIQKHTDSLLANAKMQAIQERLVEIAKERLAAQGETIQDNITWMDQLAFGGAAAGVTQVNMANSANKLNEEEQLLTRTLSGLEEQQANTTKSGITLSDGIKSFGDRVQQAGGSVSEYTLDLDGATDSTDKLVTATQTWEQSLQNVAEFLGGIDTEPIRRAGVDMLDLSNQTQLAFRDMSLSLSFWEEFQRDNAQNSQDRNEAMRQGMVDLASTTVAGLSEIFGKSKALAIASIAIDTGKAIAGAIAAGAGVPFPGNLAAIGTGIAAVLSGIGQAKSALSAGSLAAGGIVNQPMLSVIGDAGNNDPEIVAPLSKLPGLLGIGGTGAVEFIGVIKGKDLHLIGKRVEQDKSFLG